MVVGERSAESRSNLAAESNRHLPLNSLPLPTTYYLPMAAEPAVLELSDRLIAAAGSLPDAAALDQIETSARGLADSLRVRKPECTALSPRMRVHSMALTTRFR